MKSLPEIKDPIYIEPQHLSWFQRFALRFLNDKKDLAFLPLLVKVHVTVVPMMILLFTPILQGAWWWAVFIVYTFLSAIFFRGPFGLFLHNINHRRFFKKKYEIFNKYIIWFVCPIFGHSPESYAGHHVGMHHAENNQADDTSCTLFFNEIA